MNIPRFTHQTLLEIYGHVRELRAEAVQTGQTFSFDVPSPDIRDVYFSGEAANRGGERCIVRSYRAWIEFGELMQCRFRTPTPVDNDFVRLTWEPFQQDDSWHAQEASKTSEKYGTSSLFFRLNKLEDPHYFFSLRESLLSLQLQPGDRILALGVHKGDEFHFLRDILGEALFSQLVCVGIDHCESAVHEARKQFHSSHVTFRVQDINELVDWDEEPFQLLLSIGTLQSPGVKAQTVFRSLVKHNLSVDGAVLLGFPNCRYIGGELQFGARMKNYESLELSLPLRDLYVYKKYLQKQQFRVRITGKYYWMLTGSRRGFARVPTVLKES